RRFVVLRESSGVIREILGDPSDLPVSEREASEILSTGGVLGGKLLRNLESAPVGRERGIEVVTKLLEVAHTNLQQRHTTASRPVASIDADHFHVEAQRLAVACQGVGGASEVLKSGMALQISQCLVMERELSPQSHVVRKSGRQPLQQSCRLLEVRE